MIGVDVREVIDGVGNSVSSARFEQRIVWIEDLPGDDDIPLPQQAAGILTLLAFEHNVESVLPLLGAPSVKLSERLLEDRVSADMDGEVLAADALVQSLQLRAEVSPLDVEVQDPGVVPISCSPWAKEH